MFKMESFGFGSTNDTNQYYSSLLTNYTASDYPNITDISDFANLTYLTLGEFRGLGLPRD
jgi:hypothetical protein